jgi:hypothetical protein
MYGKGKGSYKFKIIKGVISWKNEEMERFMPVSAEILTRVIFLYEKEFKHGLTIWKQIEEIKNEGKTIDPGSPLFLELTNWMEQLRGIFSDTEPFHEKEKWADNQFHLN